MAGMEKFNTYPVVCEGGLDSNQNFLMLSQRTPGAATSLLNFESSLFGGYRRLSGFTPLEEDAPEVDPTGAEGKIYGLAFYDDDVIAARKQQSGATYKFYKWDPGLPWDDYATGLTLTSTGVDKIRNVTFNFTGDPMIAFVDGVNNLALFDGSTWVHASSSDTGADYANAGGNQIIDAPSLIALFFNHIFISGDATSPHIISHSAPTAEYDWLSANGAGQIVAGFDVVQLKVFREELYVFGENDIKKIVVDGSGNFLLKDVASNIGCLAPDSVVEINGDLLFLSQDGFRTIAGTEKIGDIELGVQSKLIQQDVTELIDDADLSQVHAVIIKRKSQVRFFFSDENLDVDENVGVIGCLKAGGDGVIWEWGRLVGIRTSCTASEYINTDEYVLHGDYNGKVYRQEVGNNFDGAPIRAVYTMPYLDFGDVFIRKTIHKVIVFIRPEGETIISANLQFDWDSTSVLNPNTYLLEAEAVEGGIYDVSLYDAAVYAGITTPVLVKNVEGSGMSTRLTFFTEDMNDSYSIQSVVFEYSVNGRK
jgi:hypothetical protein